MPGTTAGEWPRLSATSSAVEALAAGRSLSPQDSAWLQSLVRRHVEEGPGVLLLTGMETLPAHAQMHASLALSAVLGAVMPQDRAGTLVREVRDRGTRIGEGHSARYADSRHGGSLHTDGAESQPPVPDYFTLYCIRQALWGGALQTVHVQTVLARLRESRHLSVLRSSFEFDRRGDELPGERSTVSKPILFEDEDGAAITYLRDYIELGHLHRGVPPLTAAQVEALDALDDVLSTPEAVAEDRMRPGEFAVFNNRKLLHGRTTFVDGESGEGRLLYRTWVQRRKPR